MAGITFFRTHLPCLSVATTRLPIAIIKLTMINRYLERALLHWLCKPKYPSCRYDPGELGTKKGLYQVIDGVHGALLEAPVPTEFTYTSASTCSFSSEGFASHTVRPTARLIDHIKCAAVVDAHPSDCSRSSLFVGFALFCPLSRLLRFSISL